MNQLTMILGLVAPLLLGGCGAGGGSAPAPAAETTDFTEFVTTQFDQTDNVTNPIETNGLTFSGLVLDDETAFDAVLGREADENRKADATSAR